MADTVWPQSGEKVTKVPFRRALRDTSGAQDFVKTGFAVSIGTGQTVNIAAGEAYTNGVFVKRDVATNGVAITTGTRYVFVYYDDALRNTVGFVEQASATPPSAAHQLLAEVVASGGAVTSVTDKRNTTPIGGWRDP